MAWNKNTDPEKVKEYNHQYYLKKTKLKRQTDEYKQKQKEIRQQKRAELEPKECPICHSTFTPEKSTKQKYCCKACKLIAQKIQSMLYRKTDKFKEQQRKYRQSEKYKEYRKKYTQTETYKETVKRYQQSEKGKATYKKYQQSEKGKTACKKFRQSEKGKAIIEKYRQSEKGKLANKKCEERKKLKRKINSLAKLKAEIKELEQKLSK